MMLVRLSSSGLARLAMFARADFRRSAGPFEIPFSSVFLFLIAKALGLDMIRRTFRGLAIADSTKL